MLRVVFGYPDERATLADQASEALRMERVANSRQTAIIAGDDADSDGLPITELVYRLRENGSQ